MLLLFWLMLRLVVVVLVVIMMMMVGLVPVLSGQRPSQLFVLQPDCLAALPCPPESWSDPPQILAPLHRSWSEATDLPAHYVLHHSFHPHLLEALLCQGAES